MVHITVAPNHQIQLWLEIQWLGIAKSFVEYQGVQKQIFIIRIQKAAHNIYMKQLTTYIIFFYFFKSKKHLKDRLNTKLYTHQTFMCSFEFWNIMENKLTKIIHNSSPNLGKFIFKRPNNFTQCHAANGAITIHKQRGKKK